MSSCCTQLLVGAHESTCHPESMCVRLRGRRIPGSKEDTIDKTTLDNKLLSTKNFYRLTWLSLIKILRTRKPYAQPYQ